jgi:hypothetical protein
MLNQFINQNEREIMMKKFLWLFVAACLVACPGIASAGETDLLIQKLVEKGILTASEAQILQDDVKQDVAKQNAKGTNDALPHSHAFGS